MMKNDAPKRPRLSPEEVGKLMIERLIEAIYPVLIPMEQQDMAIQAANRQKIASASDAAWRAFNGETVGRGNDEKVMEAIALATKQERERCIKVVELSKLLPLTVADLVAMLGEAPAPIPQHGETP